ncbi:hypothetical protein D3C87_1869480 [compost metagenome]
MGTQAWNLPSRTVGMSSGMGALRLPIRVMGPLTRASSSSSGNSWKLWVPTTTSTEGTRARILSFSCWATQPMTAIWTSGLTFL